MFHADRLHLTIKELMLMPVRHIWFSPSSHTMRKALLISSLATITNITARLYVRAPIDEATLTKVRANAITSSQRRYVFSPFFAHPPQPTVGSKLGNRHPDGSSPGIFMASTLRLQ